MKHVGLFFALSLFSVSVPADQQTESDLRVYEIYYNMTDSYVKKCDSTHEDKDTSKYWGCIEFAFTIGLGTDDARKATKRLNAGDSDEAISMIRYKRSIWKAYEAGEISYEMAKLKIAEIDFSMRKK